MEIAEPKNNDKKTILIIDDSAIERAILKKYLKEMPAIIVESSSASEGISKARQLAPDLIIMDVIMPGINGFQATRELTGNNKTENIPIILCSSKGQITDKMWGLRQGAKGYIVKPVDKDVLLAEINKAFV